VIVAKANKHVVAEPGGADDMFREMQSVDVGLERRMLRQTASAASKPSAQKTDPSVELSNITPTFTDEELAEQAVRHLPENGAVGICTHPVDQVYLWA
jgi:hypothetical protein